MAAKYAVKDWNDIPDGWVQYYEADSRARELETQIDRALAEAGLGESDMRFAVLGR
jgi:hypothetical protein